MTYCLWSRQRQFLLKSGYYMGLLESKEKEVDENPNFNIEEYNQKVQQSGIYTNQQMTLHNNGEYYMRDHGFVPKTMKVEESTISKVGLNFTLVRNSLSIILTNNGIQVSFKYTAKKTGEIRIYVSVQEIENEDQNVPPQLLAQQQLSELIQATAEQSISRQIVFDSEIRLSDLEKKQPHFYPLVVTIGDEGQKIVTYARSVRNFQDTVTIKQSLYIDNRVFYLQEVFGLAKSSEERLCIICYSQESDVIIFPCGHLCLCFACCGELMRTSQNCPICRKAIKNYEKVKDMSEEEGTKKEDVQKGREGEEGR